MKLRVCVPAIFATLALGLGLAAQTADTATIRGHVSDATHAAVPGAQVTASSSQTHMQRTAQTDADGNYTLPGLPVAGTYTISAAKTGFATASQDDIALIGGVDANVDLTLDVASGKSVVMVSGAVGTIHTDEPQLGINLTASQIAEVPLFNNQITYLPLLNSANRPAINQGDVFMNEDLFTTNGGGRRQTTFVVDGGTANDNWGRQTIFSNVPESAVQEMTVLENGFSAEYGDTTGGVVNIVTKSGGQALHGDLEYAVRPNGLEAGLSGFNANNATSGNQQTTDEFNQGAWSIGGPLGGRTQFEVAGETNFRDRGSPIISPLDPGIFVGRYHDGLLFTRIDHQINANNSWFARADVDSFYDTNPNGIVGGNALPTVDRVFSRRTYTGELGETSILSPTWVNAVRLQYELADPITQFSPTNDTTAFAVPIAGEQTFTSGNSQSAKLLNHQYEANDIISASVGRHFIKFGADVIFGHDGGNSKEFGGFNYLGTFTFATCSPGANGVPNVSGAALVAYCESPSYLTIGNVTNYTQGFGNPTYTIDDTLYSIFAQDDYKVSRNLTLNLGLRYERQTFTNATKNFAPRVGFSYSPWGDGKTVVRGGYGLYYSQVVDNTEANYVFGEPIGGVFTLNVSPGQAGFPTSLQPFTTAPPPGSLSSLYIRPGMASYYNQFFPTSTLVGYQNAMLNPLSAEWTFGVEHQFSKSWVVSADYVGSHTDHILRPLDVDPPASFTRTAQGQSQSATAANCSRPYWISWYASENIPLSSCGTRGVATPAYSQILSDVNDGIAWYDALEINASHRFSRNFQSLISYTWSHTIDTVDQDSTGGSPNDPNFPVWQEKGNASWDQRHRFVWSGMYSAPFKINLGGDTTLASGLAYNLTTGANAQGDAGAETDRPVINGVVVGRDTGRGRPIYSVDPFIERPFTLSDRFKLNVRAESFDFLNHANFVGYNGTYGNTAVAPASLGSPAVGVTSQLPAREFQFSAKLTF